MAKTAKKVSKQGILASYMDYVLEMEHEPKSVYKLCKHLDIDETEFYHFFGSISGVKEGVWNAFYTNTIDLLEKNKTYVSFSNREKMLTFFFTFFEMLTKNRSYVLFVLGQNQQKLHGLSQLKNLRKHVKAFASDLAESANAEKSMKLTQQNPKLLSEGAWLQLLFLLNFWMKDNSPEFEQTDLAIEKSVRTIFDVFDNSILEGLVDFGKFIYKSKIT